MSNPPKQKGTAFEREVLLAAEASGLKVRRTPAGWPWDLEVEGSTGHVIEALVTRPDRGKALATVRLDDLFHVLREHGDPANIECKRYARFVIHTIFNDTFKP